MGPPWEETRGTWTQSRALLRLARTELPRKDRCAARHQPSPPRASPTCSGVSERKSEAVACHFLCLLFFHRSCSTTISRSIPCEASVPWGGEVQVEEQMWGDARPRGPSALFPTSQPETVGPRLPAENRVRASPQRPWDSGSRATVGFQQRRAWSCVAGDGLRAALGPQLPAAAAAQGEGAARGGAPRDPGASAASVRRAGGPRSLHTRSLSLEAPPLPVTVVRQRKNKERRERISLPRASHWLLTL